MGHRKRDMGPPKKLVEYPVLCSKETRRVGRARRAAHLRECELVAVVRGERDANDAQRPSVVPNLLPKGREPGRHPGEGEAKVCEYHFGAVCVCVLP